MLAARGRGPAEILTRRPSILRRHPLDAARVAADQLQFAPGVGLVADRQQPRRRHVRIPRRSGRFRGRGRPPAPPSPPRRPAARRSGPKTMLRISLPSRFSRSSRASATFDQRLVVAAEDLPGPRRSSPGRCCGSRCRSAAAVPRCSSSYAPCRGRGKSPLPSRHKPAGPSLSLIPHSQTILRAMAVARSISLLAPVVMRVEDQLLGDAAAEQGADAGMQPLLGLVVLLLARAGTWSPPSPGRGE